MMAPLAYAPMMPALAVQGALAGQPSGNLSEVQETILRGWSGLSTSEPLPKFQEEVQKANITMTLVLDMLSTMSVAEKDKTLSFGAALNLFYVVDNAQDVQKMNFGESLGLTY